jgi:type II secretory pathway component PulF
MARFRYAALTTAGRTRRGLLEAESREDALRALAARGETATELKPSNAHGLLERLRGEGTGITRGELAAFLADLAALNDAGVPLRQGLDVLSGEASGPRTTRLARLIAERLDAGSDFGRAARVEEQGDLALAAELVRAGEASGRLSEALRFAAELLHRQSEFARRVTTALAYPAFLMTLSVVALIALATFAGPAIAPLLEEAPHGSPALSAVLAVGEALRQYGIAILVVVIALALGLATAARRDPMREALATIRMRMPLFGAVVRDLNCGAFARALGAMLAGGAPAGAAFDLAAATAPNSAWRARFLRAGETLRDGRTVGAALAALKGASPELARLARVGEESGALGEMLNRAGDLAVERALRRLDQIAAAAGPLLILVMGGFTGWLMSTFLGGLTQLGEGVL